MKRPMVVAVVCGTLAALCTGLYLVSLEQTYKRGAQKVKVLTARQHLDHGTMLDPASVEEKLVPKEYLQPKALQSSRDLVSADGRHTYTVVSPVEQGEQITATKLAAAGAETGISAIIPSEKRAVTLPLDRGVVAGIVKPGNRVDVVGVFEYEDQERRTHEAAYTILQNILVLSVGKDQIGGGPAPSSADNGDPGLDEGKISVSFAVSPVEAATLALGAECGSVRLSLRPSGDTRLAEVRAVRLVDITREFSATVKPQPETGRGDVLKNIQRSQKEALEIISRYQKK